MLRHSSGTWLTWPESKPSVHPTRRSCSHPGRGFQLCVSLGTQQWHSNYVQCGKRRAMLALTTTQEVPWLRLCARRHMEFSRRQKTREGQWSLAPGCVGKCVLGYSSSTVFCLWLFWARPHAAAVVQKCAITVRTQGLELHGSKFKFPSIIRCCLVRQFNSAAQCKKVHFYK